jgi:hypothetical protein
VSQSDRQIEIPIELLGHQLREKIVEMLVLVEHLSIMATPPGLSIFGNLCMLGAQCCQHVALGRREQALFAAITIGRAVPHAFPVGREREVLEQALEEIIAVLECPTSDDLH